MGGTETLIEGSERQVPLTGMVEKTYQIDLYTASTSFTLADTSWAQVYRAEFLVAGSDTAVTGLSGASVYWDSVNGDLDGTGFPAGAASGAASGGVTVYLTVRGTVG